MSLKKAQFQYGQLLIKGQVPDLPVPRTDEEAVEFMEYLTDKRRASASRLKLAISQQIRALEDLKDLLPTDVYADMMNKLRKLSLPDAPAEPAAIDL